MKNNPVQATNINAPTLHTFALAMDTLVAFLRNYKFKIHFRFYDHRDIVVDR